MTWFLNHYTCERWGADWTDEWSCTCDDDCPHCGARSMTAADSDDLTSVVEENGRDFDVLWSTQTAGHSPDYEYLTSFPTRAQAIGYIASPESGTRLNTHSQ